MRRTDPVVALEQRHQPRSVRSARAAPDHGRRPAGARRAVLPAGGRGASSCWRPCAGAPVPTGAAPGDRPVRGRGAGLDGRTVTPSTTACASTWKDGRVERDRRSVPLRPHPERFRPAPDRRRHPASRLREARRARASNCGPIAGVHFAVWAPNADRVSVVGDFNGWDGRVHPMRCLMPHGVWEIFIPGLGRGEKYKFELRSKAGVVFTKADPVRAALRAAAAVGLDRLERRRLRLGRRGVDGGAPARRTAGSIGRCRSTRCTSGRGPAARTASGSCRTGSWRDRLVPYVRDDGLHAHRAAAGDGAPVRRVLGLPGRRLLRADQPPGRAGRLQRRSSTPATRRASACCSTGCPATSRRTRTASRASTAPRSTSTRTRARASTWTGAR